MMKLFLGKSIALASVSLAVSAMAAAPRVLFIGNSYTSRNALPQLFQQVVASTGVAGPEAKSVTPRGFTLFNHSTNAATLKLIDEGDWEVVVLQGNSEEAAFSEVDPKMRKEFLVGASNLVARVRARSPEAKIVFYETWARHADLWKKPPAQGIPGKDPVEMQAWTRRWYQRVARGCPDCVIAPVGEAWELNYQSPSAIRLHNRDNSHPEIEGSYLAAVVLYGAIYHPDTLKVPFRDKLTAERAEYLQDLAAKALAGTSGAQ